jgi:hypothetical protein
MGVRTAGESFGGVATSLAAGCTGTDLTLSGALAAGAATLASAAVAGAATVGTTLGVTGAATLSSTLAVAGDANLSGHVNVLGTTKDLLVNGTLRIANDWVITPETVKTGNYNLTAADALVYCNSASPVTFTLPATGSTNRNMCVRNVGAGTLTIARNGNTINGTTIDPTLSQGIELNLQWNGSGWYTAR